MPMLKPFEDNNQEHIVEYYCKDGTKVRLHYQHTYSRRSGEVHTATTENRPDIVLTVVKQDGDTSKGFELTYLFDAKYRLNDDSKLNKEDRDEPDDAKGADTPPYDAINQMHRYRDAIYYGSDMRHHSAKEIIGGYILFPGRGENDAVRERFFYKSIVDVNIGAFPLLPDASDPQNEGTLLYEFLSTILQTDNAYDHVKGSIPQKGLQYKSSFEASETDLVLVGYYQSGDLELIKKNRLYYVPVASERGSIGLVSGFEKTKYLLLHNNEDRMLLRLNGEGPKFFPKAALEAMGFTPEREYYLGFAIRSVTPVNDIDITAYSLEGLGRKRSVPYFTTIEKIKGS